MSKQMDKEMLLAYRERWREVNEFELKEARQTTFGERWRQLNAIIRMAVAIKAWPERDEVEIAKVRERWSILRTFYAAKEDT